MSDLKNIPRPRQPAAGSRKKKGTPYKKDVVKMILANGGSNGMTSAEITDAFMKHTAVSPSARPAELNRMRPYLMSPHMDTVHWEKRGGGKETRYFSMQTHDDTQSDTSVRYSMERQSDTSVRNEISAVEKRIRELKRKIRDEEQPATASKRVCLDTQLDHGPELASPSEIASIYMYWRGN